MGTAPGQSAMCTSPSFSTVPTSRFCVASTICTVETAALAVVARLFNTRYNNKLAIDATANAKTRTPTNLLFIAFPPVARALRSHSLRPAVAGPLRRLQSSSGRRRMSGRGIPFDDVQRRFSGFDRTPAGFQSAAGVQSGLTPQTAPLPWVRLAGGRRSVREGAVGRLPDRVDVATRTDEQGGRGQRHEGQQESVF